MIILLIYEKNVENVARIKKFITAVTRILLYAVIYLCPYLVIVVPFIH